MAILYSFAARCLFGVVFLHKAKQGTWLCEVLTHKSLPHQRTAHWFTMKPTNPQGMVGLLSLPLASHGYCDVFFGGNFFESLCFWAIWRALRNLDDYVLRDEREHGLRGTEKLKLHDKIWIFLPSDSLLIARERCFELSSWMSVFKMFAFTTQHVVIEFPELTSDCPESKTLKKNSHKKHIAIPMTRGRDKKTHLA